MVLFWAGVFAFFAVMALGVLALWNLNRPTRAGAIGVLHDSVLPLGHLHQTLLDHDEGAILRVARGSVPDVA